VTQSYENLFYYRNFVLDKRRKQKQKFLNDLKRAKKEYFDESERIKTKGRNDSFEKVEFSEPIIQNKIIQVKENIKNHAYTYNYVKSMSKL
jgi:hypothetical protein